MNLKNKKSRILLATAAIILATVFFAVYIFSVPFSPIGSDIYGHLFKSELLYSRILEGDYSPKYTQLWYNGMQPFRYWAPLSYYFFALLKLIFSTDTTATYLAFAVISFFVGAMSFLLIGIRKNRILLSTILGIFWFFMPDNMRVFFSEGNFPRMFISMLLPLIFYFVLMVLDTTRTPLLDKKSTIAALVCIFSLILVFSLSHLMIAAMTAVFIFVLCLVHSIVFKSLRSWIVLTVPMILGFVAGGIFIVPALRGGVVGMGSSATSSVMQSLSVEATKSLDPILRLNGGRDLFYFGLALLIVSVFGLIFSLKSSRAWFLLPILIFLSTTPTFSFFLEKLPMSEFFWMQRFTPIATVSTMIGLLQWDSCNQKVMTAILSLLLADLLLSFSFLAPNPTPYDIPLIDEARQITSQRMAIFDLSLWGSMPSYKLPQENVMYSYGWSWQGAQTASNIMLLNTAMEHQSFSYLFDRALELGNDTVLVKKDLVSKAMSLTPITTCAQACGYKLVCETEYALLFHRDTPKAFGTKTLYPNLAIGTGAKNVELIYPSFMYSEKICLDDYTFEEISGYKTIYLSGFTYKNKAYCENLLRELSDSGVKIVIDSDALPMVGIDGYSGSTEFLGFTISRINLFREYPPLYLGETKLSRKPFSALALEGKNWHTTYILDSSTETTQTLVSPLTATYSGQPLTVVAVEDNISIIGFNLFYYAFTHNDNETFKIFEHLFDTKRTELPTRTLVPIEVSYDPNQIKITSPEDDVNTTIAFSDIFTSESYISSKNNLLTVNSGETTIHIKSPYTKWLFLLSATGFLGMFTFSISLLYYNNHNKNSLKTP